MQFGCSLYNYMEFHDAYCWYSESFYAGCPYAEHHYSVSHDAAHCYAGVALLRTITLSVTLMNVVAPTFA
jgi:hypothetical protein